jgi:hypothetical protein
MGEICSTQWKTRNAYRIFVGKYERKITLEGFTYVWKYNIIMYLKNWNVRMWIGLSCSGYGSITGFFAIVMNLQAP